MVGNGTVPTFGLWNDFRQKLPLWHYARFYAECLESPTTTSASGDVSPVSVTHEQALANMRLFASDVIPRVRDAVKI